MLLKKKIKLNPEFINLITHDDVYVFNIQTISKKNNKTRTIKATTQYNLKEISYSSIEQHLVFYIHTNLDKSLLGDINDKENRIRIYEINNSHKTINKAPQKNQTPLNRPNTKYTTPKKTYENLPSYEKNYTENHEIQKFKTNMEEKINSLTIQVQQIQQSLLLKEQSYNSPLQTTDTLINCYKKPNSTQNSLDQKLQTLEEILLRIENKNHINFKKTTTTKIHKYPRNGKKKGFIPVRVFLSHLKIKLINVENNGADTIRTYFLQSKIQQQLKNITIKTKKEIKTNIQISFYIHNEQINLCDGILNDIDNQVIFYELDKNYKYIKSI